MGDTNIGQKHLEVSLGPRTEETRQSGNSSAVFACRGGRGFPSKLSDTGTGIGVGLSGDEGGGLRSGRPLNNRGRE